MNSSSFEHGKRDEWLPALSRTDELIYKELMKLSSLKGYVGIYTQVQGRFRG